MYDIIGDVHGCYDELIQLLKQLGYHFNYEKNSSSTTLKEKKIRKNDNYISKLNLEHPEGRKIIFLGDLTDRGPASIPVLKLVFQLVEEEKAYYVPGNHCDKLYRFFIGRDVKVIHGLETTVEEWEALADAEKIEIKKKFIYLYENAPYYKSFDDQRLIVSHAGIRKDMVDKDPSLKKIKTFCLYGDITGEKDETGFPIRRDWAQEYDGESWIIYGHTPVKQPRIVNNTVNIDTGSVFGGHLTGLRYPEFTFESVPSSMPLQDEKFRLE